jgi:hypothetical protein
MRLFRWPAPSVVLSIVAAAGVLRAGALRGGIDRLTTVDTWTTPLCVIAAITAGGFAAVSIARFWFFPDPGIPLPTKYMALKRHGVVPWCAAGIVISAVFAFIVAWMFVSLLGVGAQYLRGTPESFAATVVSKTATSPLSRDVCRLRLGIQPKPQGSELTVCIATTYRPSLAFGAIEPGAQVIVSTSRTALGTVIESIRAVE